jgi:O-acetyl-ADP-ribose deacetylase (regulator of RNase III)
MSKIKYVHGDATSPSGSGVKVIAHICNDAGGWGAGFVLALSSKWEKPEKESREWFMLNEPKVSDQHRPALGKTQYVEVEPGLYVANMIAQTLPGKSDNRAKPPIRYDALVDCLSDLAVFCAGWNASVHMPRIGSKLAGGRWEIISQIIETELCEKGVDVTVYLLDDDSKSFARTFSLTDIASAFRGGIEHGVLPNVKPNTTEYIQSIL